MKMIKHLFILFTVILLTFSCESDNNGPAFTNNVLVINEGNFFSAEGSISGYNLETEISEQGLYESVNGFAPATTIQALVKHNENFILIGNNPDKVELLSNSLEFKANILTGFTTPYSFDAVGNKGYVTNWGSFNSATYGYDNSSIVVIDLVNFTILKTIPWDNQPQHVLASNNKIYISNVNSNSISILDPKTDEIAGSIETPFGPDKMDLDKNGKMWVICTSGALVKIDLNSNSVETTVNNVSTSGFNEKMVLNTNLDKIYYLSTVYEPDFSATTSVFEMDINATTVPTEPIVSGTAFYGIGINDQNILFVGDHNNYQRNGTVYMYDLEGNSLGDFESGIVPNGFIFR